MDTCPYTFDRAIRLLIGVIILAALFLVTKKLSSVLLPFIISWFIAYMLHPLVKFFQYKCKLKNRVLSVLITLLCILGVFVGFAFIFVPIISSEMSKLNNLIIVYMSGINADSLIPPAWQNEIRDFLAHLNLQTFLENESLVESTKKLLPKVWNVLNSSISFLMGITVFFVGLLYLIFILIDFEKIAQDWLDIIPTKYRNLVTDITHDLERGMNRYFRGQALVAAIVGVLFAIGFSIIGLPLAIVIGLFIGLLNMVPYLQIIGLIPCLLLGLLQSAETGTSYGLILLGIGIVFIVVQLIQDIILVPKIMGNVTGMNPAIILLSLSIWGSLLGIAGLIIALPITTLLVSYYKRLVLHQGKETTRKAEHYPTNRQNN